MKQSLTKAGLTLRVRLGANRSAQIPVIDR